MRNIIYGRKIVGKGIIIARLKFRKITMSKRKKKKMKRKRKNKNWQGMKIANKITIMK
jgi:hypothetical protein